MAGSEQPKPTEAPVPKRSILDKLFGREGKPPKPEPGKKDPGFDRSEGGRNYIDIA
jgi:hypothetical protein